MDVNYKCPSCDTKFNPNTMEPIIPRQFYGTTSTKPPLATNYGNRPIDRPSLLCQSCIHHQSIILQLLSIYDPNYSPYSTNNKDYSALHSSTMDLEEEEYDPEEKINSFKAELEKRYPLCELCKTKAKYHLEYLDFNLKSHYLLNRNRMELRFRKQSIKGKKNIKSSNHHVETKRLWKENIYPRDLFLESIFDILLLLILKFNLSFNIGIGIVIVAAVFSFLSSRSFVWTLFNILVRILCLKKVVPIYLLKIFHFCLYLGGRKRRKENLSIVQIIPTKIDIGDSEIRENDNDDGNDYSNDSFADSSSLWCGKKKVNKENRMPLNNGNENESHPLFKNLKITSPKSNLNNGYGNKTFPITNSMNGSINNQKHPFAVNHSLLRPPSSNPLVWAPQPNKFHVPDKGPVSFLERDIANIQLDNNSSSTSSNMRNGKRGQEEKRNNLSVSVTRGNVDFGSFLKFLYWMRQILINFILVGSYYCLACRQTVAIANIIPIILATSIGMRGFMWKFLNEKYRLLVNILMIIRLIWLAMNSCELTLNNSFFPFPPFDSPLVMAIMGLILDNLVILTR